MRRPELEIDESLVEARTRTGVVVGAERDRVVPAVAQQLGQGPRLGSQRPLEPRHAVRLGSQAGEDRGRRRAGPGRVGDRAFEDPRLLGEAVDARRQTSRRAVGPQAIGAQGVDEIDDDVGRSTRHGDAVGTGDAAGARRTDLDTRPARSKDPPTRGGPRGSAAGLESLGEASFRELYGALGLGSRRAQELPFRRDAVRVLLRRRRPGAPHRSTDRGPSPRRRGRVAPRIAASGVAPLDSRGTRSGRRGGGRSARDAAARPPVEPPASPRWEE